ncbi:MAG: thermonuclease family protein, partial [Carboxydocellales bacterium]
MIAIFLLTIFSGCDKQPVLYNKTNDSKQINLHQEDGWFKVKRVVDGDTFIITKHNDRVRLIGVDAPESVKPGEEPQHYGHEASNYLNNLLAFQEVKLVFDLDRRDKYGRLLAYVYLKDGTFVNASLLKEGYARVLTIPPNTVHAAEFLYLQKMAKKNGKG